jgi:nucleoside-diphosphate-sugar epimerase
MRVLITGAAGNMGSLLARSLLGSGHTLRLMFHRRALPAELAARPEVEPAQADLDRRESLLPACEGVDCIVHFAGLLFAPWPERFLPRTNLEYVRNLVEAALAQGVGKFILVSFPHVEGESTPEHPARGLPGGKPTSVHARTRLEAEKAVFAACAGQPMVAVALRAGMVYARGVLMLDAARWLLRRRLLHVWRRPTWIHPLALPDFLAAARTAIESPAASGIYNLTDDGPLTLQTFLDRVAAHWGLPRPLRLPEWTFFAAALAVELFAWVLRTPAPLTRDFIRIGMASYVADNSRMKQELLPSLRYPTLEHGLALL